MSTSKLLLSFCLLGFLNLTTFAQKDLPYQTPPLEIVALADAPVTPSVRFSKSGQTLLILHRPGFLPISTVAQPVLGLAGLRINPAIYGSAVGTLYASISVKPQNTAEQMIAGLPTDARISNITWHPDETRIAFSNQTDEGIELWVADLATRTAKKLGDGYLNDTFSSTIQWAPDGQSLLALYVPASKIGLTNELLVPKGPVIQENDGKVAPSRTYQNLLKNAYDEKQFDHYLTAQLKKIDLAGQMQDIGEPHIYRDISFSPDGQYLLVEIVKRPYSYLVPVRSFPYDVEVWDSQGRLIQSVYQAPLAEGTPIGFDAVVEGPRHFSWRSDAPSTLFWVEALDRGDPNQAAFFRDALYLQSAPFDQPAQKIFETKDRYRRIYWANDQMAIVQERWWKRRNERMTFINPSKPISARMISDRSYEDGYTDPGDFVLTDNAYNRRVLLLASEKKPVVFTISEGASPLGDRPFLLRWNLLSGETDTLFKSSAPYYEYPAFFNDDEHLILTRESVDQAPNYYRYNLKNKKLHQITDFPDPYPSLKGVYKEQVSYNRNDGLRLTGTLYLPKDYKKEDGPLPLLLWAYPREFKSQKAAGQVKGSPYRFTRLSWGSPIYWVTRGYAILDNADMPVVGTGNNQPNDTFVEQIRGNAQAAIDYLSAKGVIDTKRVGVGGHSYGAFMTANLLAHTDLFAAGIARSGAYNRSLTPFGFQAEERTYWQAPEIYYQMSPFSYANKIKAPLLLIHGNDDENSGTFPVQSERLYNALKGHGAKTRLVILPHEFHHYRAKESVFHMLWEMDQWLEKYVKKNGE